jgi:hypothetical protein
MRHSIHLALIVALLLVLSLSGRTQERANTVEIGEYAVTLPTSWQRLNVDGKKGGVIGRKIGGDKKPIADILSAKLAGTIVKESDELIESVKKNPTVLEMLEKGEFATKDGTKGRKVLLSMKIKNETFGTPIHFYSIYLPTSDGSCITIKVMCNSAQFEGLRKEFEGIVKNAKKRSK